MMGSGIRRLEQGVEEVLVRAPLPERGAINRLMSLRDVGGLALDLNAQRRVRRRR
jgi:hypothetical protein